MGCGDEKLSKYLTQTFIAHCNAMIGQQVTLSGDAEWPKVADAVIEAALGMIVGEVLVEHMIEGAFTQHDHPLQGLLLDGAYEPFAVRIQIRTAWRQEDRLHPAVLEQRIKRLRKFGVSVVDEISLASQEPVTGIGQLPGALLHEGGSGMLRDACDVDAPCGQFYHNQHIVRH